MGAARVPQKEAKLSLARAYCFEKSRRLFSTCYCPPLSGLFYVRPQSIAARRTLANFEIVAKPHENAQKSQFCVGFTQKRVYLAALVATLRGGVRWYAVTSDSPLGTMDAVLLLSYLPEKESIHVELHQGTRCHKCA